MHIERFLRKQSRLSYRTSTGTPVDHEWWGSNMRRVEPEAKKR